MFMNHHTIVVLADPSEPTLKLLEELPPETSVAVGNRLDAFDRAAPDADVIFRWSGPRTLLREVFLRCPRLGWVHSRPVGLDQTLFPELVASAIPLTNSRGVFSQSLGEFVLGGILYFAKDFRRMIRSQMAGEWRPFDVVEISGQTAGLVGYGDIGRAIATRLRAMGMRLLAMKRSGPLLYNVDPLVDRIYSPEKRLEMISLADYVVVSTPLTPETRGMIGEAEFAAMKPNAVVINVGRGEVIDEAAMLRALTEERIKGAALDVFEQEPLPAGHPFYRLENVLLSPHCADHTATWLADAMRFFLDNFGRFSKGEPLMSLVNKKRGY
jgi:phosphoglycerate dehydrogenase-like enzyme